MASPQNLLSFLDNSTSPYHAVQTASKILEENGFKQLSLCDQWKLQRGGKYFITKGYSSLIAFALGGEYEFGNGYVVVGSHTDSPCLKVRPVSRIAKEGFKQIAVDTYGGGLWRTWFDRSLSLAGLVTHRAGDSKIQHKVVDFNRKPLLCIPNLAIHLVPGRDESIALNPEEHLHPIFTLDDASGQNGKDSKSGEHHHELLDLLAKECGCAVEDIIDFDLRTFVTEPAQIGGLNEEFLFSGRLDNLVGVYSSLYGLIKSCEDKSSLSSDRFARVACFFDHEEVGSGSNCGARSAVLEQILKRLVIDGNESSDGYSRAISNSYIISADQAHAAHPNYPDKHERNHRPRFDGSVVAKINANQRYATNTLSFTILQELANRAGVKLTKFVVKNDSPCGSTIGPFVSMQTGALTIDTGCPQFAMHSCRETGDLASVFSAVKLYAEVYNSYGSLREGCSFVDA